MDETKFRIAGTGPRGFRRSQAVAVAGNHIVVTHRTLQPIVATYTYEFKTKATTIDRDITLRYGKGVGDSSVTWEKKLRSGSR